MQNKNEKIKIRITQILVILSFLILSADFIYKTVKDITSYTKEKCILYLTVPKAGFLFYEYFLELFFVVLIGVFIAVILESWFSKYKKFYPKNPVTAFLYASLIPVCSCTAIPVVKSMEGKVSFRTLISFIISAPLLNPYIIVLSFSVLGFKYGVLRIVCSFLLAILTGFIVEFFYNKDKKKLELSEIPASHKNATNCPIVRTDKFLQTYNLMKSIFPYLILAGVLGVVAELYMPVDFLEKMNFSNNFLDLAIVILIGIPMYYCNGADVILLKPLITHSGLSLGTAMAFSLTSTAICITAIVMLIKFLNKKLTMILIGTVAILTFIMGYLINTFL
ncbi:MAG: hypothetical protein A2X13_06250 [Bacteroidetes bacterium GWC2_33_15]|nr:MAG: hypothetical protein A2X10_03510 [Bacteroidetes bacterium GWA2_33_15]OFX51825.1 MAG: hypothetical protein A2X13_06250 [Bacteroidetes bacterium GWC2_33_15]OFX66803.1 MAG: hypothetical protein A2X15_08875 [Bacteroidetes bacterium GWB2_32_14]OFX67061.1 MAG: hypothetical protein A2X14_10380 [Bacteroidetes bacterium GWD2_33_33]HAN17151.1 hypothetical protein [Bacteroidales bacterium]